MATEAEVGATANRYEILAKLAAGGMAEIFLARGEGVAGVERYCVLKRILRDRAGDAQFIRMFLDEARLAAQLQHPNIASTYDIGMLGGAYFFTMEYVHGETLWSVLHHAAERSRPLPVACALTIGAGIAAGLHHAHDRRSLDGRPLGIVHRDLSPANVMIGFEGLVKIVDFGVAKAAHRAVESQAGTIRGTISYLSPEQCRGGRVDRRSDLFSLGVVMWEMLTGERLYQRASDFENMAAIVDDLPAAPSALRPDVPRAVDALVLRLLAKSPADRPQTAGEVVLALEDASLRTGTILSTSAVGQLMHELFGARSEPWLVLEDPTLRNSVTLMSLPVPDHPDAPVSAAEHVDDDLDLARVPDLSAPRAPRSATLPPPAPAPQLPTAVERPGAAPRRNPVLAAEPPPAAPPAAPPVAIERADRAPPRRRARAATIGLAGLALATGAAAFVAARLGSKAVVAPPAAAQVRPDPAAELRPQIARVLAAFVAWARDHAGAPCPDAASLGVTGGDPWGRPWRITCTDQPGDQIVGVISAGPDGVPRTADDVASWQLGREITDVVAGARWTTAATAAEPAIAADPAPESVPNPREASPPPAAPPPKPTRPEPRPRKRTGGMRLDADGLPVSR